MFQLLSDFANSIILFIITCSNPQWPVSLLLLFAINQLIAAKLQAVPLQPSSELSRQGGQLVKTLTELASAYVQLARVCLRK